MIDLVIFDCDGVLVDSETLANQAFSEYLATLDIHLNPRQVTDDFVGRSLSSCKVILEDRGHTLPDSFVEDIWACIFQALSHDLQPIKGIHSTLDQIALPYCLASSGMPKKIEQSLRLTNLSDYFGANIFSAKLVEPGRGKPKPDLFLLAAETMGFNPARTLVIEDSEVGVQAGVAAQMIVVGFIGGSHIEAGSNHADTLTRLGAQHIIEDMLELPTLINRYNGS
jgi:HAD superfamily hydrolase (TIGR01509 family)